MRKIFPLSFPLDEIELYDYLKSQNNSSKYIRNLIRQDIEGKKLKDILADYLEGIDIKNIKKEDKKDLSQFKNQFQGLLSLSK
ncbi:hypothetical protein GOQ27_15045 [Clostridium sp. D2Q-11]|uniref:Uncharacterized protein n=1 Tax=Anaeromonas frigoriresistens TaxID=2683708 RepID=A0A942UV36_9FIRM|nr:hypothetical protein [Anaeromonas frigoriresistens]MBS4539789.1 hypothetical protein [Anaeromonas frigoriresistens]